MKDIIIALPVSTRVEETGKTVANPAITALIEAEGGKILPIDHTAVKAAEVAELISGADGVLMPGGGDIDPKYFGETPIPECNAPDVSRDEVEYELMRLAREKGLPMLGICRGCQIINVIYGGTLWQDLPAQKGLYHRQTASDCRYWHCVEIAEGTLLRAAVGASRIPVNSWHHQAIKDVAKGLKTSAVSATDGIAEAIENEGGSFVLGVQWHPETIPDDPASKAVFRVFMDAVKKNRREQE